MNNQQAVFCIFLMRFNLQPLEAIKIVTQWFEEHPSDNWGTLKSLLKEDKITLISGKLKEVSQQNSSEYSEPVKKYRGVELPGVNFEATPITQTPKKLRYRGQEYTL
ncbi:hypothetical protein PCC7424_4536 [Gloeothece citriformis PCC 7424]|uniref:Uncharacterized protein n=1 Tax=Gloeothece citriformis (strain PCC 7424) TaxID=65393 RepID=B7KAC5_GLOC7|nr:hypothetical protein [Gloeothece citriformis]ACK72899.1 hypothetical protein PCC7424_4536 [Gloeothece citriformis PCC 7424]